MDTPNGFIGRGVIEGVQGETLSIRQQDGNVVRILIGEVDALVKTRPFVSN